MDSFLAPSATQLPSTGKNYQQRQNEQIMNEVDQHEKLRIETLNSVKSDIEELQSTIQYDLPSLLQIPGTERYREVFDKMLHIDVDNYSVKDVNFDIENAYFENKLDKVEFDKVIKQSAEFILAKMKERNFDANSNTAKNFMLFEFFTQPMQIKGFKEKHFPIKYDFEDYWGRENWAKMFVTKLLKTNTGQCHSMPLLYLILAEAIDAEAYLALSPNHSYIKFQDEKSKWYNLELTNGMLTVSSFILNNGYITAEAMQNKIYMQNLTKQQVLSQFYTDLASGYIHKFGYDEFVDKVINKAIELYPTSINANMVKANYNEARLKYVVKELGINTQTQDGRNKILNYPQAIEILQQMHAQYKLVDDLGFQLMPADAYEKWLNSLKETKNKEESEKLAKQFKGTIIKFKN
ncbi:hypothetical protein FK004_05500 [Flavobacterium kingsejongi]|uniref:Uncharacterized protein n=2 Tax=Flavobacterium kingsejongi TaxID=1678728 RepID=A0A2S1LM04_9FLAO|nr:hypothetical protein FK004_05500 [Flavobacterium kingsejongi]